MRDTAIDRPDCSCLDSLLARVEAAPAEMRLAILKQAVVGHGGSWDLPSDTPGIYEPALMSIQVFGVFAAADNLEELAINWMRAAGNTLAGKREVA
jgi:hypothetical protein